MTDVREALDGLVRDAPLNEPDWGDVVARSRAMGRRHLPRPLALVAAVLAIFAVILSTPAFGLQGQISHLFAASDQKRPPELIQRFFRNLDVVPGGAHGVIPRKARVAVALRIPGYGTRRLWVAPTRDGGFCTTAGCDRDRRTPFRGTLLVTGPTTRNSQPMPHSSHVHVFFEGYTLIRGAARVAVQFEDRSSERTPLVWVSEPVDAGFFVYDLPREHWKVGKRPIALTVENARGKELTTDGEAPAYFLQTQALGLAPPPAGFPYRILWIVLAAAAGFIAAVLGTAFVRPGWAKRASTSRAAPT